MAKGSDETMEFRAIWVVAFFSVPTSMGAFLIDMQIDSMHHIFRQIATIFVLNNARARLITERRRLCDAKEKKNDPKRFVIRSQLIRFDRISDDLSLGLKTTCFYGPLITLTNGMQLPETFCIIPLLNCFPNTG